MLETVQYSMCDEYLFILFSLFTYFTISICLNFFLLKLGGLAPLLALLVNPRLQGLRPLQPMLGKSHLFLANMEQILIRFVYMRDQEKK